MNPEELEEELLRKGLEDIFFLEEGSDLFIGGHSLKQIETEHADLVEKKENSVDWNEQWASFAEDFRDGKAHIQIKDQTLLLAPGPGFGDLSHPTTHLMIQMMEPLVEGEAVIDIGCGSGILSLAALLMGAKSAIGIDIDEGALIHAKNNAKLNHLGASFEKSLPEDLEGGIFLMNMIVPEQKEFSPSRYNHQAKLWIVSGIMVREFEKYLIVVEKWNWNLISQHEHLGWVGCIFSPLKEG